MKRIELGELEVSRLGLGAMGMSAFYTGAGGDDEEATRTIHRAIDLGITFIDTAEMYGPFTNEELVGRAVAERRDEVQIATKFGLFDHETGERGINSRPENVRKAIDGSLRRLGTDHIDLIYQHRVDPKVPIEEVAGVVSEYVDAGKVRFLGLSEASPETIRRAHATHPVTALQTEYSLWTRDPEAEILPLVEELGIGFVPYSPLGRGFLTGQISSPDDLDASDFRTSNPRFAKENFDENMRIVDAVREVAEEAGATPAQVALAWLLAQGDHIAPIPGTKRVERVEENAGSDALELTTEQLQRLGDLPEPAGDSYADMSSIDT